LKLQIVVVVENNWSRRSILNCIRVIHVLRISFTNHRRRNEDRIIR
jgi:hypothetical protein